LGRQPVELFYKINNTDRAVGARIAGVMAERFGNAGLPERSVRLVFSGSAGQSFGAFALAGLSLQLTGETNDYLAKGMHGGEILIKAPVSTRRGGDDVLVGNTGLYGATGGRVFIAGSAGERFAVRNSGATAVVEGLGDHGCEYMTGGLVLVLGKTGKNFAAGMSGGLAFVYDLGRRFSDRCNQEMVRLSALDRADQEFIYNLIATHWELTGSQKARKLLDWWQESLRFFWKVTPQSEAQLQQHVEDVALDASAGK
jgi:glutamate synthase domain-containing protein 3